MGRKGKFEENILPRLADIPNMLTTMTEGEIAEELGVAVSTWEKYKNEHEELRAALKDGKKKLVRELKENLKKKAIGFFYKETKKTIRDVNGVRTSLIEEFEKYSPPDVGAIHLLLKNLDENWRNDDAETMRLKREKLELDKKQAEAENW